ncbi:isochorismatase family protein [Gallaecimonas kandeliae]|uniref:cysteine hydrolase family protein n=1 Tax=Gallaecimonas kandeliae TaxID=3029055 RepID=UPI0026497A7C|nr:isochorismatase family protein [Gallaecimonas kandeliae]WKE65939.1 isochorismatase family protein [Gallaecimonas kandeliae]
MTASATALVIIDVQNDYFEGGNLPLWQAEETKDRILALGARVQAAGGLVILVQHLAKGPAPFFNPGTPGAEIHTDVLAAFPDAPLVVKHHADSFEGTELKALLAELGIRRLLLSGMMTQNCLTHTALSRAADAFAIQLVGDCCTTQTELLHKIALSALSNRDILVNSGEL